MFNQLLSAQSVFSDPDYLPPQLMDFGLETHIFRWRAISKKMPKNHPFFDLHQNRGDHNFDIKTGGGLRKKVTSRDLPLILIF